MGLIHNNNLGLYSGVSTQATELRLPTHCEDMINCYPSIEYGVQRRNPTQVISETILVEDNQFLYNYDRGLAGESSEKYVITIDKVNGLRVFDVDASVYRTVNYSGAALTYLESSNPEIGFSALTIKDVTFIANKDIVPRRTGQITSSIGHVLLTVGTVGYSTTITSLIKKKLVKSTANGLAPARIKTYKSLALEATSSVGATTTVVIDGVSVVYTVKIKDNGLCTYPESLSEYRMNLANLIRETMGANYEITIGLNGAIYVYKINGTAITATSSISFPLAVTTPPTVLTSNPRTGFGGWTVLSEADYGVNPLTITSGTSTEAITSVSDYDKKAFIWIKQTSVDPTFPYTFTVTIKETNGTVLGTKTSAVTTTTGVASDIAVWVNTVTGFSGEASGSVCKIVRTNNTAFEITVADTYGNQASSSWMGTVEAMADLPKSFPFKDTVVKVDGLEKLDDSAYWVKYNGTRWIESYDPNMMSRINSLTMPHKLTRNADFTFTLSAETWDNILVGDEKTQALPEFLNSNIKDLFFINGRFGILTTNGITLSQQGVFTNFFRTTILALLDDSAITTYIDSSKAVGLEYAVELHNLIILFGDKAQFALDGSKAISPQTISVQPVSGFEINKNVKPLSLGDSVFFIVSKNGYSSLMEMNKSTISATVRAVDVSAHVPYYITGDVIQITASSRDSTIFLRSREDKESIYVYKYYGTETEKIQMAWSKWEFNMAIKSMFAFDKSLYLFGSRYDASIPLGEFSLVESWDDSKVWADETYWTDTAIASSPSFEKIDIAPYPLDAVFNDAGTTRYNSLIELSEWAITDKANQKDPQGTLLMKTIQISAEDTSAFYLRVYDKERGTYRDIPALYTVDRKPFISGNAKNTKIQIISSNGTGFQINAISLEGQYNTRSKRV